MRKIVAGLFISLDGVVEGPGSIDDFPRAGWSTPYFSNELGRFLGESGAQSDALLLGRVTYQGFEQFFTGQGASNPAAVRMNGVSKYVVSHTLTSADWANSTLLSGNPMEEVRKLKARPGGQINMSGSVTLVQALLDQGLLDGLDLLVHPVVVGAGRRLFGPGTEHILPLTLRETRLFPNGVVLLSYETAPAAG